MVLEDGKVLEDGDHDDLIKAGGRYAQLISNYQMEPQVNNTRFLQGLPMKNSIEALL